MIHAYIGDGKGKSTAALGLLIRALGAGMRVTAIYFDKGSRTYRHQELNALETLGVPITVTGEERMRPDGTFRFGVTDQDRREAQRGLACAKEALQAGTFDLIVLDEILSVVSGELLSPAELASLLAQVPERIELVLTGRCRDEGWLEPVDLISRVQKVRHYFDRGTQARRGIEY